MIELGVVQAAKDVAADIADGSGGGGREAGTPATKKRKKEPKVAGPGRYCSPRHRHAF